MRLLRNFLRKIDAVPKHTDLQQTETGHRNVIHIFRFGSFFHFENTPSHLNYLFCISFTEVAKEKADSIAQ